MALQSYQAEDLFDWVTRSGYDFTLLDVRNSVDFERFKVEGPHLAKMVNLPYVEFVANEEQTVARVKIPRDERIRIVCAKEGSAQYVAEILVDNGWQDVQYLQGGIKTWGNLLAPELVGKEDGYQLYQFIRPGKASCSYGLICGAEMMLFDPSRNVAFYQDFARQHGCRIVRTFETHLQADYISGSQQLARDTGAEILGHENDFRQAAFAYQKVIDGQVFAFSTNGPRVVALHTPGHTPGSTSYLVDDRYMISGDAVFILSIGRPDLGGQAEQWSKMLFATLQTKIAALDDDILVLPGHYMDWNEANSRGVFADTLGRIKSRNAEIYGIQREEDFVSFINDNMRGQPEVYVDIRKVNAGLLEVDDEKQEIMDLGKNECAASAMGHPVRRKSPQGSK